MHGNLTPSSGYAGTDTFSFCKKMDKTLVCLDDNIQLLAKNDPTDYNPDVFQLEFYEIPKLTAEDLEVKGNGFDRASTLRLVHHASVCGAKWRLQLVRAEIVMRIAENEWRYIPDAQEDAIRKQSMIGSFMRAIRVAMMVNQHQMILQVQLGSELMELQQSHRIQYPGFTTCATDCITCKTSDLMFELESHMAQSRSTNRPEPFGEIGAVILEKIMMEAKDTPLFLLNTSFVNALFVIALELAREELPYVVIARSNTLVKFERLFEIYRFITKNRFERQDSLENLSKINMIGIYPSEFKCFRQLDEDQFSGWTRCIHMTVNLRCSLSLTSKLPARMLNWNGNIVTLPYAVPSNVKYNYEIKDTAFTNEAGIGDREVNFPKDKYDVANDEFFIRPRMDDAELNASLHDYAIHLELINNAARTIIVSSLISYSLSHYVNFYLIQG